LIFIVHYLHLCQMWSSNSIKLSLNIWKKWSNFNFKTFVICYLINITSRLFKIVIEIKTHFVEDRTWTNHFKKCWIQCYTYLLMYPGVPLNSIRYINCLIVLGVVLGTWLHVIRITTIVIYVLVCVVCVSI